MSDSPPDPEGLRSATERDVATVAKGGAVQIAGQLSQRGLSFLFTIVAFHFLGKTGYGIYRQVAQALVIAAQLGLAGFNYAAMRFVTLARADRDVQTIRGATAAGVTVAGATSVVVGAAVVLGAGFIASFFHDPEMAPLLRLGALYVPLFAVMQVLRYCTQAFKTMVPSVLVGNVVQPVARFVLGVVALLVGFEVAGAVGSLVASVAIGALAGALYVKRMLPAAQRRSNRPYRAMTRFALPQAGASLLGIQTLGLGVLILGRYEDPAIVGLFAVALALQGPGTVFLGGIVNIWAPVVSDLHHRGEIERLGRLYKTVNRWIATFSFPAFAALIIEPDVFARFYGGDALGAAPVAAILAAGNFFYTGTGPTGYVLSMTGRPGVNFVNSLVAVTLYVALGALFVPDHGIIAMAWIDAATTATVNTLRVVEAWVLVGVQPFGRSFLKPVVATIAGAATVVGVNELASPGLSGDITGIVLGAAVYVAALRMQGIDQEERLVLDRIKARVLRKKT